ncbi:MAG TPA: GNAT family N-acetyltransferase [Actinomycetota bacterium]|nr:GNAT family N-acetyltransferase [Actinomycetota bacterium]
MSLPADLTARPVRMDDLDAVVALFRDVELELFGEAEDIRSFLEETWNSDWMDLPTMSRLVVDPAGAVVAFAGLEAVRADESVDAFIRVHPEHRDHGIGSALVAWSEEATARLIEAGETSLLNSTSAADAAALRLLRDAGYERVRTFWHMKMDLPADLDAGAAPTGVTIRTAIEGRDDADVHEVLMESFRTHFAYVVVGRQEWWDHTRRAPGFDPTMILVAERDGRIVGVCTEFPNGTVGWIGELGVRPEAQGSGIGKALLRAGLADLARRGFRVAQLNVDAQNETGATRLYASVGMEIWREWPVFEKRIAAAVSSRP